MAINILFFGSHEAATYALGDSSSVGRAFLQGIKQVILASDDTITKHVRGFITLPLTFVVAGPDEVMLPRNTWHPSWKNYPIFTWLANDPKLPLVQNCQTWCYRNKHDLLQEIRKCLEFRVKCAQLSQEIEKLDALQRKLRVKGVDALFQHHTRGSLMRTNAANETGSDGGQDNLHTWAWSSGNADNPVSVDGYTQLQRADNNADVLVAYMSLTAVQSPQDVPIIPGTVYILQSTGLQRGEVAALFDKFLLRGRRDAVDWNGTDKTDVTSWSDMLQYALAQYFAPNDATSTLVDDDTIEDLSNRVAATVLELQSDSAAATASSTA